MFSLTCIITIESTAQIEAQRSVQSTCFHCRQMWPHTDPTSASCCVPCRHVIPTARLYSIIPLQPLIEETLKLSQPPMKQTFITFCLFECLGLQIGHYCCICNTLHVIIIHAFLLHLTLITHVAWTCRFSIHLHWDTSCIFLTILCNWSAWLHKLFFFCCFSPNRFRWITFTCSTGVPWFAWSPRKPRWIAIRFAEWQREMHICC